MAADRLCFTLRKDPAGPLRATVGVSTGPLTRARRRAGDTAFRAALLLKVGKGPTQPGDHAGETVLVF